MSEKPLFEDIKKILIEQNREPAEIEEIENIPFDDLEFDDFNK